MSDVILELLPAWSRNTTPSRAQSDQYASVERVFPPGSRNSQNENLPTNVANWFTVNYAQEISNSGATQKCADLRRVGKSPGFC